MQRWEVWKAEQLFAKLLQTVSRTKLLLQTEKCSVSSLKFTSLNCCIASPDIIEMSFVIWWMTNNASSWRLYGKLAKLSVRNRSSLRLLVCKKHNQDTREQTTIIHKRKKKDFHHHVVHFQPYNATHTNYNTMGTFSNSTERRIARICCSVSQGRSQGLWKHWVKLWCKKLESVSHH